MSLSLGFLVSKLRVLILACMCRYLDHLGKVVSAGSLHYEVTIFENC